VDLVFMPFFIFNLDLFWDFEPLARWLEELGSFARVLIHDPRGTGLSDREVEPGDLGTRASDLLAVLDDAGIERASVMATRSVGGVGVLFGGAHPDRLESFIWLHAVARDAWAPDYPWGERPEDLEADIRGAGDRWGSVEDVEQAAAGEGPMGLVDPTFQRWMGKMLRNSVTPARAEGLLRSWYATDVRDVLSTFSAPTLVLARETSAEESTAVASMIQNATVQVFLGGERRAATGDRFLATVLFTDIVASTDQASEMGDAHWQTLVAEHHRLIRGLLTRFGGTEMDTAGDGFFAAFDTPGDAVHCASEAVTAVRTLGLQIRAGVHTGEVELVQGDVRGVAVHTAARIMNLADPGEVWLSATVMELAADAGLAFEDVGEHQLKGIPGTRRLYRIAAPGSAA
jgi:class 3 adenylate cyclase